MECDYFLFSNMKEVGKTEAGCLSMNGFVFPYETEIAAYMLSSKFLILQLILSCYSKLQLNPFF